MRNSKKTSHIICFTLYLMIMWVPFLYILGVNTIFEIILPNERRLGLLVNSIKLGGCTVIISCLFGLLAALFIHNSFFRNKWYRFFFIILMPIPYYIYALSWMYIVRILSGIWPKLLRYSTQGFTACLFVEVMTFIPIATLLILIALEMRNCQIDEMALLYKGPSNVLLKNIIPDIFPYIVAAAGIIFIMSVTDFSVPSMFQYNTYALEIFSVYSRTGSVGETYKLLLPLFVILLLPLSLIEEAIKKISKPQGSKFSLNIRYPLPLRVGMFNAFILLICQVILPVLIFIITAGNLETIYKSFEMIYEQIGTTMLIAIIASIISIVCAGMACGVLVNNANGLLWFMALGTIIIPGALQAMGILDLINGSVIHGISMTVLLPGLGCAIKYLPFAVIILVCTIKRVDQNKKELALLYSNKWYQYKLLELGMYLPGILGAMILVFFLSFGEEGIILVLMPPGAETVSVKIYNYLHYGASEYVSGFCLIVTLFMFMVEILVVLALRKRYRGKNG